MITHSCIAWNQGQSQLCNNWYTYNINVIITSLYRAHTVHSHNAIHSLHISITVGTHSALSQCTSLTLSSLLVHTAHMSHCCTHSLLSSVHTLTLSQCTHSQSTLTLSQCTHSRSHNAHSHNAHTHTHQECLPVTSTKGGRERREVNTQQNLKV